MDKSSNASLTLSTGRKMPILALGTWKSEKGDVGDIIKHAVRNGVRHIDCAKVYENQKQVGKALKELLESKDVKREDLFITSKLWNNCHRKEYVEKACRDTLQELGLDYLDLYLVHWPNSFVYDGSSLFPKDDKGNIKTENIPFQETWAAMEDLVDKGLVKDIGISNFIESEVEELLKHAKKKPVVNQLECHPYLPQKELKRYLNSKGILLEAYSPLGGNYDDKDASPMNDDTVEAIAKKYKKTTAQILLRWGIDHCDAVVFKSTNEERVKEDLEIFSFKIDEQDIKKLEQLGSEKPHRFNNPEFKPNGQKVFADP